MCRGTQILSMALRYLRELVESGYSEHFHVAPKTWSRKCVRFKGSWFFIYPPCSNSPSKGQQFRGTPLFLVPSLRGLKNWAVRFWHLKRPKPSNLPLSPISNLPISNPPLFLVEFRSFLKPKFFCDETHIQGAGIISWKDGSGRSYNASAVMVSRA